jgi:hypothetical protein
MPEPTPVIDRLAARAFGIPTDALETDGTLAWDRSSSPRSRQAASKALATQARRRRTSSTVFANLLAGADAFATGKAWERMFAAVRNLGTRGIQMPFPPWTARSGTSRRRASAGLSLIFLAGQETPCRSTAAALHLLFAGAAERAAFALG